MSQPDVIAGRYRIERAVGRGGMGTVWLCTDQTLNRQVAVKQVGSLPGESVHDTTRAMREARLAAALNHKNAVSIFDVVEHDGSTWLVMEYVPSRTLSQLVAAEGRLSAERVVHMGAQVAAALSSAHALGIVHRDIKPGNILVTEDDGAKISDFGIARGHLDSQLTQTGMVMGTPAFFSPELARGDDPSFASDVWAFGVTLYIAVEGAPPYETRSNPLALLTVIATEPPPPPTHAGVLAPLLAGMLERDPLRRMTMGQALATLTDLERAAAGQHQGDPTTAFAVGDATTVIAPAVEPAYEEPVAVPVSSGPPPSDGPASDPEPSGGGRPWGRVLAVLLAVAVLVVAGLLLASALDLGGEDDPGAQGQGPTQGNGQNNGQGQGGTGGPTSDPPTTSQQTQDTGPSTSATTDTETTSTDPTEETSDEPTDEESLEAAEDFTRTYFDTVTDDVDAGWALLAPSMQAEVGRASFDGFWNSVDSVNLKEVTAVDDLTVDYEIEYRLNDGSRSTETKQLTLARAGSSYLLTSDSPLG